MGSREIPVTIEFVKETKPPVFVAGTFSEPVWEPMSMEYDHRDGVYHYHKTLTLEEGKEYLYKLRMGTEDQWELSETDPTVTDEKGVSNNVLRATSQRSDRALSTASSPPKVMVEKIDSKLSFGDDFGPTATVAQRDAHNLRSQDPEPDVVTIRNGQRTPEVAAEVADSAQELDREVPTPPISDEEAGRIGLRRLSNTPIPQVAQIAAEVADTAALLDTDVSHIDLPPPPIAFGEMTPGATTPWEDTVPRFSHECIEPVVEGSASPAIQRPWTPEMPTEEAEEYDFNDPSIEEFPTDKRGILQHVFAMEARLPPDETRDDGIPPSPVVDHDRQLGVIPLPSPSPGLLATEISPSLESIPEEQTRNLSIQAGGKE